MTEPHLPFYDPQTRPWPNPLLTRASIIGHTTPTSVRLWFRVSEPGEYWLVVSRHPLPTEGKPQLIVISDSAPGDRGASPRHEFRIIHPTYIQEIVTDAIVPVSGNPERDLTQVVDLENLEPDTRYYYALFHSNRETPWELGQVEPLSFQTFPEDPQDLNFGIYSCHQPYEGETLTDLEMWDRFYQELSQVNARLVLATGDQVYVDAHAELSIWEWLRQVQDKNPTRSEMISWYRDIYRGYWGIPQVQRLFRSFPIYTIWDDHEIVDGWGSYTLPELAGLLDRSWQLRDLEEQLRLAYEMFAAATQVYREYQHSHNPPTDENSHQFDYGFDCGSYAFYLLDMRGHRDFNREELRTLGVEQWQRFKTWLSDRRSLRSQVLFIVSPVPVVHLSSFVINQLDLRLFGYQDDQRDHWEHTTNWDERNMLLQYLFEWSQDTGKMVVFISGDVHLGAAFSLSHPHFPQARVFQITSSGIAYAHLKAIERQILEKSIKLEGTLGDRPENVPYHFRNLAICRYNNFGVVKVTRNESGEVRVIYDLFGGISQDDGSFSLTKTSIDLAQSL